MSEETKVAIEDVELAWEGYRHSFPILNEPQPPEKTAIPEEPVKLDWKAKIGAIFVLLLLSWLGGFLLLKLTCGALLPSGTFKILACMALFAFIVGSLYIITQGSLIFSEVCDKPSIGVFFSPITRGNRGSG